MAKRPPMAKLRDMETAPPQTRIVIEVLTGLQPLSGTVLAGNDVVPFRGWLELAAAIERARLHEGA